MATKLTGYLKTQIIEKALHRAGWTERNEQLIGGKTRLAEDARVASFGGLEAIVLAEETLKSVNKLLADMPERSAPVKVELGVSSYSMHVLVEGSKVSMPFNGGRGVPVARTIIYDRYELSGELAKKYYTLAAEQDSLNALYASVHLMVHAVCGKAPDVETLLGIWPEAAELLPGMIVSRPPANAAPVDDINRLIGLGAHHDV